jgi:hypothetical protein
MWALCDKRTGLSFTSAAGLARSDILRSKSYETHDHILLSQIRDFPFRRLLRLAGLQWSGGIWPCHYTRYCSRQNQSHDSLYSLNSHYIASGRTHRKHHFCMLTVSTGMCLHYPAMGCLPRICCPSNGVTLFCFCGNMFTEKLPSNERLLWLHCSGSRASCHNISLQFTWSKIISTKITKYKINML